MKNIQNQQFQNITKVAKRIGLTILCCLPVLIAFAYLTRNVIKSDAIQIVCFVLIMGVAVLIEELISRKKEKAKERKALLEKSKDVFK